jgi:hypothetical protein
MKRWTVISGLAVAAAVFAASAAPALTADRGTVNMTVQVASPCLTVSPESIAFPAASFSTSAESPSTTEAPDRATVTNCSASSESLFFNATDAVGSVGAKWALGSPQSIGINRYGLRVASQEASAGNQSLNGALAAGDVRRDPLVLVMPTAGSDGAGQTMSMSLTYTATF